MEHAESGGLIVNQPATSVNETSNTVTYDFKAGETSRQGTHYAEVVVTYADGEVESEPADGYYQIEIAEPTHREVPPEDLDAPNVTATIVGASEVNAPALKTVETLAGPLTGGAPLSNLTGENLAIESGVLNATDTDTDTDTHLTDEQVRMAVAVFLAGGTNVQLTVDDAADTLTINADHDHSGDTLGTAADPVAEEHVQSTTTGELSVSDSQPVTAGPVGDGGEWVPLEVFSYGRSTSFSTTSTTYEQVTTYIDYPIVDYGQISLTNVNQLGRSLVGSMAQRGGTSDDVYVRLVGGSPEISGVGPASSSIVSTNVTDVDFKHLEMKVDGGEGEAFGLSIVLWGQIS